jgi:outer membrane lipoprotein SlyB
MRLISYFLFAAVGLFSLVGCAPSLSPNVYSTASAGQVHRVVRGVVVSSRVVRVSNNGNNLGVGALTGGALGAIAGSEVGRGSGSLAAGIGGALLGGLAGNQVENRMSAQTAVEYVVKLRNNCLISVVQGPYPTFNRGQHVLVQYGAGGRAYVIADPGSP